MVSGTRKLAIALALGAVTILGACKRGENAADTTLAARDTSMNMGAGSTTAMQPAPAAPAPMTDAGIFAMLAAANQGEIAAGKLAQSEATNAEVKAFARDMVAAHTAMLNSGETLAKRLKITPDTAAADSIMMMNQSTTAALHSATKGPAFDSAYVNAEVAGHEYVLAMIKRAQGAAQSADLKSSLTATEPKVQAHLDRIRKIQEKMK